MSQDGFTKIKAKIQELSALIKEETVSETKVLKDDILKEVKVIKSALEERLKDGEVKDKVSQAKDEMFRKLGYSQDELAAQKDEIVLKAADSLIDAVNKLKSALLTEKEKSNH